jgi:hypothetical protein
LLILSLYGISYITDLVNGETLRLVLSYVVSPIFTILGLAYLAISIHLVKNQEKPSFLTFRQIKLMLKPEVLFALDEYLGAKVKLTHYSLLDYRNFFVKNPLRIAYLAIAGGLIGISFSCTWPLFIKGAIIAVLAPYLYKVTEEFFGREVKTNLLKAEETKRLLIENGKEIDCLIEKYKDELNYASSYKKFSFYFRKAIGIFFRINLPVLSGVFTFARSRLAIAIISGIVTHSLFPIIFTAEIASMSIFEFFGLGKFISYANVLYLPHTISGILGIFILVIGLKLIDFYRVRNMFQDIQAYSKLGLNNSTMDAFIEKNGRELSKESLLSAAHLRARPGQRNKLLGKASISFGD